MPEEQIQNQSRRPYIKLWLTLKHRNRLVTYLDTRLTVSATLCTGDNDYGDDELCFTSTREMNVYVNVNDFTKYLDDIRVMCNEVLTDVRTKYYNYVNNLNKKTQETQK